MPTASDERGTLSVVHRHDWHEPDWVQWNLSRSTAGTLRGVHAHRAHHDRLLCAWGSLLVGLQDLRPQSPTFGVADLVVLRSDTAEPQALLIPPGVAHGFYSPEPTVHVYSTDTCWSPDDEFGCRWDDPDLAIPWPGMPPGGPTLSPRDAGAGTLAELLAVGW